MLLSFVKFSSFSMALLLLLALPLLSTCSYQINFTLFLMHFQVTCSEENETHTRNSEFFSQMDLLKFLICRMEENLYFLMQIYIFIREKEIETEPNNMKDNEWRTRKRKEEKERKSISFLNAH
jgi:hypothetical protein